MVVVVVTDRLLNSTVLCDVLCSPPVEVSFNATAALCARGIYAYEKPYDELLFLSTSLSALK